MRHGRDGRLQGFAAPVSSRPVAPHLRVLAALVLAAIGSGVSPAVAQTPSARDTGAEPRVITRADGSPVGAQATAIKGEYLRLLSRQSIERVAVADPAIAAVEVITNREVLVLGKSPGLTNLIFWFPGGGSDTLTLVVQRDLAVLAGALRSIHASITVEGAPDRDAVVLQGAVPDVTYSRAAEAAARAYLVSGRRARAAAAPLILAPPPGAAPPAPSAPPAPGAPPGIVLPPAGPRPSGPAGPSDTAEMEAEAEDDATVRVPARLAPTDVAVINLIKLDKLPPTVEERIRDAIRPIGGERVAVRRLLQSGSSDDEKDVFVLEGSVANQVVLTRVMAVAATVVVAVGRGRLGAQDIRVLADESGGLVNLRSGGGRGGMRTFCDAQNAFNTSGAFTNVFGTGGGGQTQQREVLLDQNIGRAKAVTAANGRVLSFIRVDDLPQVRIGVKLFEVNRTRLLSYSPDFTAIFSSQQLRGVQPAPGAQAIQGNLANIVTPDNFQQVLGFLAGAFTANSTLALGNVVLDLVLTALESQGIARSLSAPSLTVLSGEVSQFQVGGEIPVTTTFVPPGTVLVGAFNSVSFVPFGVQLCVRPLVGERDQITLDLVPQVIVPDAALTESIRRSTGTNPPTVALDTRSISTSTTLPDGQALLIGGLLSRSNDRSDNRSPILSSIPLVKYLFQSYSDSAEQRELVILVEPTIVRDQVRGQSPWAYPGTRETVLRIPVTIGIDVRPPAGPRSP